MRIKSAQDIKKLLGKDALIRSLVEKIEIISNGKPPVPLSSTIFIPEFPVVEEFDAIWELKIFGVYGEDLNDVLNAAQAAVGGKIVDKAIVVSVFATEDLIRQSEIGVRQAEQQKKIDQAIEAAKKVKDGADGSKGEQGPPGPEGPAGKDGRDGRDGKDIDATETKLFDLADVESGIKKEKGQVLTYDGEKWTNLFVPRLISSSVGSRQGEAQGSIQLDVTNTEDPVLGQIVWEQDEHTATLGIDGNVHNHLGHDIYAWCRNATGATIDKGMAVMFAGTLGASGRVKIAPMIADGTYPGYVFLGFAAEDIPDDTDGNVISYGKLKGVNTSIFTEQSILWCDPTTPGGLTETEPEAPNLRLPVAAVISSANNGTLMVRWDIGRRLDDLHNVQINSPQNGDVLTWVAANNRWEATVSSGGGIQEAPQDGNYYVRQNGAWVDLATALAAIS